MKTEAAGYAIRLPGKVVPMDHVSGVSYRGIDHIHLEDFLSFSRLLAILNKDH
jgi:hypothetical protein